MSMSVEAPPWSWPVPLSGVQRDPVALSLRADGATCARIATSLGLAKLEALDADVRLTPWLDGAAVRGRWRAAITQVCGVSLEPFDSRLQGEFEVHCAPPGSASLPDAQAELTIDPDAEDPPDLLEDGWIDVAAYVVEHLALELDPFPRKPGVPFEPPAAVLPPSPFAALAGLRLVVDTEPDA